MLAEMPLAAAVRYIEVRIDKEMRLTADVCAGLELSQHCWVHRDHDLVLVGHVGVALLHLLCDPILEGLSDHSSQDIHDPLLGHLRQVHLIRQVVDDTGILSREFKDPLEAQVLVLGHEDGLDVVTGDVSLFAVDDVLQEVHVHVVCKNKIVQKGKEADSP